MMKLFSSIGATIVLGLGGIFGIHKTPPKMTTHVTSTQVMQKIATPEAKPMKIKDIVTMKGNQKCTFSDSNNGSKTEGVVYITGGKIRGDITTTVNGKTNVTHIVSDKNIMHVWIDGQGQGYTTTETSISQMNINQESNYTCTSSTGNDSMFVTPTGIQFMDFSKLVPSIPPISITGIPNIDIKARQCSTCEKMTDPAKTQCMSMFQCN